MMHKIQLFLVGVVSHVKSWVDNVLSSLMKILDPKDGTTVRSVARVVVLVAAHFGVGLDTAQLLELFAVLEIVLQTLVRSHIGNTDPEPPAPEA